MSGIEQYHTSVLWRNIQPNTTGLDYCSLWQNEEGWALAGSVVQTFAGVPGRANYRVQCDANWRTQTTFVEIEIGETHSTLSLQATQGRWYVNTEEQPNIRGCLDVDLGVTPATNTLPIRRLQLAVGESREVVATWIRFPDLQIQPLYQRYTRLDEANYRYDSFNDSNTAIKPAFSAELTVDTHGLVQTYAGGWERLPGQHL